MSRNKKTHKSSGGNKISFEQLIADKKFAEVESLLCSKNELERAERHALGSALLSLGKWKEALFAWRPLMGKFNNDLDEKIRNLQKRFAQHMEESREWASGLSTSQLKEAYLSVRNFSPHAEQSAREAWTAQVWSECDAQNFQDCLKILESHPAKWSRSVFLEFAKLKAKSFFLTGKGEKSSLCSFLLSAGATQFFYQNQPAVLRSFVDAVCALVQPELALRQKLISDTDELQFLYTQSQTTGNAVPEIWLSPGLFRTFTSDSKTRADFLAHFPNIQNDPFSSYSDLGFKIKEISDGKLKNGLEFLGNRNILDRFRSPKTFREWSCALEVAVVFAQQKNQDSEALFKSLLRRTEFFQDKHFERTLDQIISKSENSPEILSEFAERIPLEFWNRSQRERMAWQALKTSQKHLEDANPLWTQTLKQAVHFMPDGRARTECELLLNKVQESVLFMQGFPGKEFLKKHKTMLAEKNIPEQFPLFLTSILDALSLLPERQGGSALFPVKRSEVLDFFATLSRKRGVKKLIPLFTEFMEDWQCHCDFCYSDFLEVIQDEREDWGLPKAPTFPLLKLEKKSPHSEFIHDVHHNLFESKSIFTENPYQILELDTSATKAEILKRVMQCQRLYPQQMIRLRNAQAALFDEVRRPIYTFFHFPLSRIPQTKVKPDFNGALNATFAQSETLGLPSASERPLDVNL